ncbi:dihydrolipoyllysine-residue acetyltransferase component 5 of pyruvate dehydrogenase complex, chloroplastic [Tanacetum coccineum]
MPALSSTMTQGKIVNWTESQGHKLSKGQSVVVVESDMETAAGGTMSTHPASQGGKRVVASPYANKLAKEWNVDLSFVLGTGPLGRIVAKDVEAAAAVGGQKVIKGSEVELGSTMQGAIKSKGVTMTALLAKATALALAKHPVVNSSCRDGKSFTYTSNINIAVAVAIDGGLITPVLQNADKVDIYSLSRKWKELVDKAHAKQLQPHEYTTDYYRIELKTA